MVRIQGRGVAGTVATKVKHLFGLCKEFEEKMCKVSAKKQVYLFFLPSRSQLYAKNVEMEAIFNRWWCFEMQNAASANQSGATANHIVRFRGLDVILQRSLVLHPKQCGMVCIIVKLSEY